MNLKNPYVPIFQLTVQHERPVFLTDKHENPTNDFGGHGHSQTVVIVKRDIQDDSRVEVITPKSLDAVADDFIKRISR